LIRGSIERFEESIEEGKSSGFKKKIGGQLKIQLEEDPEIGLKKPVCWKEEKEETGKKSTALEEKRDWCKKLAS